MEQSSSNRRPTIVGGSPMNRLVQASSLPLNVERLLIQAALSREFRQRLLADREAAAAEAGIDLLPEERALLSHISDETLERTIDLVIMPPVSRRKFLKRAAASVVLALAGSAVLAQAACGGAAPDPPISAYDEAGHYWANLADLRCYIYVPPVYEFYKYERHPTPLLLVLPDANQTSLAAANQWMGLCSEEGIIMVVAEWSGLSADNVAGRLAALLGDADDLWASISSRARVLAGFAEGAALALQVGVRAESALTRIVACGGLPGAGWETGLVASEGTRVYLSLGRQDLNAGQYDIVVDALHAAGCEVSARLVSDHMPLAEFPQEDAWSWVTTGVGNY
jgi:predicted esterase